jgi:hypothetical protein
MSLNKKSVVILIHEQRKHVPRNDRHDITTGLDACNLTTGCLIDDCETAATMAYPYAIEARPCRTGVHHICNTVGNQTMRVI